MISKRPDRFNRDQLSSWYTVKVIVGMLVLWALVLGLGSWLNGANIWRSLAVIGSLSVFILGWLILLMIRESDSQSPNS